MPAFQTSPGTRDILPPESGQFRRLVDVFATLAERAGFGLIIPPMFEDLGVFQRIGEATDIVSKEMYDFVDKGGRHIALRPEQTAGVVRAFVQHRPVLPWKTWYAGPNFRYESAQKGRYRQFDQVGVEALGVDDPYLDVEVITLAWRFFEALGLRQVTLLLNSLGEPDDRARYREALRVYFEGRAGELTEDGRLTLGRNPLRLLDSKREQDLLVVAGAPQLGAFRSQASTDHFATVQAGLRALGVPFVLAPNLVRGLDYYRRTTFELVADALDAAQNAVGGGGRYDGLAEDLGGPSTPGVGFALGVDRTLLACESEGVFAAPASVLDVFVVDTTGGASALTVAERLRTAGIRTDRAFENRSMKSQMRAADRSGAAVAVIIGTNELAAGQLTVRPLRHTGEDALQRTVADHELVDEVRALLSTSYEPLPARQHHS